MQLTNMREFGDLSWLKRAAGFRAPVELVLLVLAFVLLVTLTTASLWLSQRTADDRRIAMDVQKVSENLIAVEAAVRSSESGQRGYLLTGNPAFLDAYNTNVSVIDDPLNSAEEAFKDTPLSKNYQELKAKVAEKLAEMGETIRMYTANEKTKAIALVKTGSGREMMREIRDDIDTLRSEAQRRFFESQRQTESLDSLLWYSNVAGAALIMFLASSSLFTLWRANKRMVTAQAELLTNNENLEAIVDERMQDLREANEEIQRFAYIVSHDLRSPLVNIMGFTTELEALSKDIFEPTQDGLDVVTAPAPPSETVRKDFDEALGFIKSSISKMDRLISAILRISREGARPFKAESVDMTALLNGIADSMTHQIQISGASIVIDPLPLIKSDRLALEQVFSNLMDNALKFLRRDTSGEIRIFARRLNRVVEFQVADNGRGIASKDKGRIFELFRRSGAQDRPGEGMGLAYVQTLVRRLEGSIRVESELGKGTTFYIILPEVLSEPQNRTER
ncbi:MAG: CHASE3 domain-containing protein [Chitinophagales bacterium]|nr:CHASE3 domain-containing protein [Hyphomicrobiales bacterium]